MAESINYPINIKYNEYEKTIKAVLTTQTIGDLQTKILETLRLNHYSLEFICAKCSPSASHLATEYRLGSDELSNDSLLKEFIRDKGNIVFEVKDRCRNEDGTVVKDNIYIERYDKYIQESRDMEYAMKMQNDMNYYRHMGLNSSADFTSQMNDLLSDSNNVPRRFLTTIIGLSSTAASMSPQLPNVTPNPTTNVIPAAAPAPSGVEPLPYTFPLNALPTSSYSGISLDSTIAASSAVARAAGPSLSTVIPTNPPTNAVPVAATAPTTIDTMPYTIPSYYASSDFTGPQSATEQEDEVTEGNENLPLQNGLIDTTTLTDYLYSIMSNEPALESTLLPSITRNTLNSLTSGVDLGGQATFYFPSGSSADLLNSVPEESLESIKIVLSADEIEHIEKSKFSEFCEFYDDIDQSYQCPISMENIKASDVALRLECGHISSKINSPPG